ncbi:uncharacterized protein LOC143233881 isoform X2 [Tachypleus tridentatus]|uniref:uncharacterized protein LOC143233881 isoform X2 n=1 Tax=Tachypleus tridentatus TaxID=6853 RepID=UPI003FD3F981
MPCPMCFHFLNIYKSSLSGYKPQVKRLRPNAVPSVFPWMASQTSEVKERTACKTKLLNRTATVMSSQSSPGCSHSIQECMECEKQKKFNVKTVKEKKIINMQRTHKNGKKITMSKNGERISSQRCKIYHCNEGEREANSSTCRK